MELAKDPMDTIKKRFSYLMNRVSPKRTVVFIDDLDRCQSDYVIGLLEGIQTLLKDAPVIFVIAADRKWLNACFEKAYKDFDPLVHEPGKPLGVLFMEKAFQFSTPVPGIPKEFKEAFWKELILVQDKDSRKIQEEARQKVRETMESITAEGDIVREVEPTRDQNKSFYEQQAIREEAVIRLAAPELLSAQNMN